MNLLIDVYTIHTNRLRGIADMKFEWDEYKNIINKEKHKISFETAAYVFDDLYYMIKASKELIKKNNHNI